MTRSTPGYELTGLRPESRAACIIDIRVDLTTKPLPDGRVSGPCRRNSTYHFRISWHRSRRFDDFDGGAHDHARGATREQRSSIEVPQSQNFEATACNLHSAMPTPRLFAGYPTRSMTLYHRTGFLVGDACALIEHDCPDGRRRATLLIRDIEADRARRHARADEVLSPADLVPKERLSHDRETQFAQAAAAFLSRLGVASVVGDRTVPLSFVDAITRAGIRVEYDDAMGVIERRRKTADELAKIREVQAATEGAVALACRAIARASASRDGTLMHESEPLTSERVRTMIDLFLVEHGMTNPTSIVAGGAQGGDCHDHGHGPLRTGEPIIVDVFPKSARHLYTGDSTRTVVHGTPTPEIVRMHRMVVEAKAAATAATRAGVRAGDVHAATVGALRRHGFERGLPGADSPATYTSLQHGTGHGLGLDGHEPPLIDGEAGTGPELLADDVITIEPGLYSRAFGGVRVEDTVVVTASGSENLGTGLGEGLAWD
jgi:Xaa-Pro aminopeptidase